MNAVIRSPRGARFEHVVFYQRRLRGRRVNFAPASDAVSAHADATAPPGTDEQSFLRWLFEQADLHADSYRSETLRRRMGACLRALRVDNVEQARQLLLHEPAKIALAVGALVIGVTSFFRDGAVFDHLARTVLPALPKPPHRRRIWSAGCSDGEELYSAAMLLAELNLLEGAELLGTDCRPPAVARARSAVYAPSALRDLPPRWREKYFRVEAAGCRVSPALRQTVQWRTADVTRVSEPGPWDLIFCRNLAMYLRPAVSGRLCEMLEGALRPGGFLVLGKAERPVGATRLSTVGPCIFRRE